MNYHAWLRKSCIIGFWLLIWQAAGYLTDNPILVVGPVEVAEALYSQALTAGFWQTIAYSFGKISLGFLAAFFLGIILGFLACHKPFLEELLAPLISFMTAVPVASFVILALIWMGSKNLSVFIAFLVVLPIIYVNTVAGLRSTDKLLLEMAAVFRLTGWKKLFYIYRPALIPYLSSSCRVALGMSWKSGVAAEVIGVPDFSIGERLYMAKIYLSTADLFAWTLVVILVSALFEKFFLYLLKQLSPRS